MSRIKEAFQNGKAFIPFITCGDPDLGTTKEIVKVMVDNGADLVDLEFHFRIRRQRDRVIQGANLRALKGGVTTDKIFEYGSRTSKRSDRSPMVFMTYANVVYFLWHLSGFAKRAAEVGMEGSHPAGCAL